eukprot:88509-Rhodomonas_salina.3
MSLSLSRPRQVQPRTALAQVSFRNRALLRPTINIRCGLHPPPTIHPPNSLHSCRPTPLLQRLALAPWHCTCPRPGGTLVPVPGRAQY